MKRLTLGTALLALLASAFDGTMAAQRPAGASQTGAQTGKPSQPGTQTGAPQRSSGRKPWWIDEASKKELGLTADQAKTLDQIFTSTKDEMAGYYEAMRREDKELQRLIDESKVEQWVVLRQIEKVESQRSNLNKLRTMTLYRMHRVLTPEQRVILEQIRDRDHKDPRKRP